jgi:DNA-binding CsgD family transcriptional regulator
MLQNAVEPDPVERRLELLSRREAEVLSMTALGMTNQQIAQSLHVTIHAVKFHLNGVYRKLGVSNRTEAAVAYLRATPDVAGAAGVEASQ